MTHTVTICADRDELMHTAAQRLVKQANAAISDYGRWTWVLSGGSTPKALYELLASEAYRNQIAWQHVWVFWGDERCVPPTDEQSNYLMAKQAMLDHVPIPESQIYRMRGELAPETAAHLYARELRGVFGLDPQQLPTFDTVLLGMGPDGHTASLFPESDILERHETIVAETWVAKFNQYRISLTFDTINAATQKLFLVAGNDKSPVVHAILETNDHAKYPAARITQAEWLLDAEAASQLTRKDSTTS